MKFSYLFSALLLLCTTTGLLAQPKDFDLSILSIPDTTLAGAESVVRYYDYEYTVHSDRTSSTKVTRIVTLFSNESRENEMAIWYANDVKLTRFRATLYDAMGKKVREAKKNEIEDVLYIGNGQFYADNRLQTVTFEYPTYPYTVVYEYEKKHSDFGIVMGMPDWSPHGFDQGCQYARFSATVPADNKLLYDAYGLPEPNVTEADGLAKYVWEVSEQPVIRWEPYLPARSRVLPNVKTQLTNFRIDEYEGTYASWQGYGSFMKELMKGRNVLPDDLKAEVKKLAASASSRAEKVDLIYKFMQDRVRYVGVQLGIGGWQPFSAEYVESNRYGDCKALSNYMGAMLGEVGIESYPVLVYSGKPRYEVREDFPTSSFNHMILYVPEEDMYLECTSNYAPTGYLGEGTHNRNVLHITPEGGVLAHTPPLDPTEHGHLRRQDITIKPDGSAKLRIDTRFFGADQQILRQLSHELTPEKQKEWLHKQRYLPDMSGNEYDFKVAANQPSASIVYATELPRYARKMGKRFFIPLNKFFAYDDLPQAVTERKMPVVMDESRFYVDTINLTLPPNYKLESSGAQTVDIEHIAGEYHAKVQINGNALTWTRTLKLLPVKLPATGYEDYRDFFLQVSKADKRTLVLKEGATR